MVGRLRGCLDGLSPRGSRLLVLRYGIGRARPHAAGEVARKLRLSPRRYTTVHRRALRWLNRLDARSGCGSTSFSSAGAAAGRAGGGSPGGAVFAYASNLSGGDGRTAGGDDEVRVLGERAEGGTESPPKARGLGGHLPLAGASSDVPYLVALGVLMLGLFAWVVAKRRRADAEDARLTEN
jgi:LPXTG-motif cell wall-anchored protein